LQRGAAWLAARGVAPNTISVAGMVCGIAGSAAFAATSWLPAWERVGWLAAAAFIQLRLLANLWDGLVAVEGGRRSAVGELYNEVPDRVSDAAILWGAGAAVGGSLWLGALAACGALLTSYVRAIGKSVGCGQDYGGPMAKPQRMFWLTLLGVYCGLTPHSWRFNLPLTNLVLAWIVIGTMVTSWLRLRRIARCLRERTE
jgi:phosphatidylglycerophosphate synthase